MLPLTYLQNTGYVSSVAVIPKMQIDIFFLLLIFKAVSPIDI